MSLCDNYSLKTCNSDSVQSEGAEDHSETGLLLAAQRGDRTAFGELCKRHSERVLRVARRIVRNNEDAEDVLQDAVLSAFVHFRQFNGRSSFSTWLIRIAINVSLMRLRKNRLCTMVSLDVGREGYTDNVPLEIADSAPTPDAIFATQERMTLLERRISEIRPHLRKAIEFRGLREWSAKEAAAEQGISVSAAKTRLFRARIELRKQLKPSA
jgi:RNA polymerase sigma-70 factor (ECF subfamily)